MSPYLRGHHVVVTGGGGGLGRAIAGALAAEGAAVTVMGRTRTTLEAAAADLRRPSRGRVEAVECDVADPRSVELAFGAAVAALGPVRVLVNNAGFSTASAVEETALESWQQTIGVNLTGAFLCIRRVLPEMRAAGDGRIVNIASTAGLKGYPRVAAYCASKHGLVGLTRALAAELTASGITVNAVCPDYIEDTPMLEAAIENVARATGKSREAARASIARRAPGGTFVTKQNVADAVLRLCSAEAFSISGQTIVVAAGEVAP